jgi:2-keto-4-pentenoate hydratase
MTRDPLIDAIVEALLTARRDRAPLSAVARPDGPVDLTAAYAVQTGVAAALGPVGAFKIGRKTADADPIMAPIFAADVRPSGAVFPASECRMRGVELEIAFRVEAPIPEVGAPDFEARLRDCVSALPVIEVVDSRLDDPDAAGDLWKLADNQINCGLVLGRPLRDWRGLDLRQRRASFRFDGVVDCEGLMPVPGGDAFASFARFARLVGDHCGGLRVGSVVTTGALTGMRFCSPGARVVGEIDGLGAVEATVG